MNETSEKILALLSTIVSPLGYEIVQVELITGRQKILRVFIDWAEDTSQSGTQREPIGVEDCIKVTRELDGPLESMSEVNSVFPGGYELEVSSPGMDRPLRRPKDFTRFKGREIRVHVFRPLTADELENTEYQGKNPKQKNFVGKCAGYEGGKVLVELPISAKVQAQIKIPLALISKANIEPVIDWSKVNERK